MEQSEVLYLADKIRSGKYVWEDVKRLCDLVAPAKTRAQEGFPYDPRWQHKFVAPTFVTPYDLCQKQNCGMPRLARQHTYVEGPGEVRLI